MTTSERYGSIASRVALATIFLVSGFGKLAAPAGTAAYIASKALPLPMVAAVGAGLLELVGGLLFLLGLRTRPAALALAAFLVPTTLLFHNALSHTNGRSQGAFALGKAAQ